MPERDVSPATSAGQALLQRLGELPKLMPYDTEAVDTILAIEQEAAAIERRKVVERIKLVLSILDGSQSVVFDSSRVAIARNRLRAILDELSPPSSDRGA